MKDQPIFVESVFNVPAATVWKALTDAGEMKNWYFDLKDFKAEKGFRFSFKAGTPEKEYVHLCEVAEVIPEKKLSYSWRYDEYPGNSIVTFDIFEQENTKALLRLSHTGIESFPQDNPDMARSSFEMGWKEIILKSLKEHLEPVAK